MNIRVKVVFALIFVVFMGLASRRYTWLFPEVLGEYPGDALWALAVYLGWALFFPLLKAWRLLLLAIGTSFIVEFSQLYHVTWLDEIRSNRIGHLFLGSTFHGIDLIAYTVGVLLVFLIDLLLYRFGYFRGYQIKLD